METESKRNQVFCVCKQHI